jgi:hypothetical protein
MQYFVLNIHADSNLISLLFTTLQSSPLLSLLTSSPFLISSLKPRLLSSQVYTFSQGKLKIVTNKQYTTIKNNYELTFDQNSEIKPCVDTADIKAYSFNFVPIDHLVNIEPNHMVDLIGQCAVFVL